MPFEPASKLEDTVRVKALLLGSPGIGKSTAVVCTAPRPVAVILCEGDTALDYARISMREDEGLSNKEIDKVLSFTRTDTWDSMMKAVQEARVAAEAGLIQTLVIDPLNFWADRLMDQAIGWTKTKDGNEDGRRAHPECTKRLRQLTYQLMALPCHVVVISHYMDVGDAAKRGGPDKVPMLPNKEARAIVHGMFPHKLWMQLNDKNERIFVTTPQGSTGPGVRGYRGASEIPADIGVLMDKLSIPGAPKRAAESAASTSANGAHKTTSPTAAAHAAKPAVATKHIPTRPSSTSSARPSTSPQRSQPNNAARR